MPRRAAAQIRQIDPDPVHRSRLVQQVINKVMLDGKKSTAERIVYDALSIIGERTGKDPIEQLETSIKALTPVLEVRSRRVGKSADTFHPARVDPLQPPVPCGGRPSLSFLAAAVACFVGLCAAPRRQLSYGPGRT